MSKRLSWTVHDYFMCLLCLGITSFFIVGISPYGCINTNSKKEIRASKIEEYIHTPIYRFYSEEGSLQTIRHQDHLFTIATFGSDSVSVIHSPLCKCGEKAEVENAKP